MIRGLTNSAARALAPLPPTDPRLAAFAQQPVQRQDFFMMQQSVPVRPRAICDICNGMVTLDEQLALPAGWIERVEDGRTRQAVYCPQCRPPKQIEKRARRGSARS